MHVDCEIYFEKILFKYITHYVISNTFFKKYQNIHALPIHINLLALLKSEQENLNH